MVHSVSPRNFTSLLTEQPSVVEAIAQHYVGNPWCLFSISTTFKKFCINLKCLSTLHLLIPLFQTTFLDKGSPEEVFEETRRALNLFKRIFCVEDPTIALFFPGPLHDKIKQHVFAFILRQLETDSLPPSIVPYPIFARHALEWIPSTKQHIYSQLVTHPAIQILFIWITKFPPNPTDKEGIQQLLQLPRSLLFDYLRGRLFREIFCRLLSSRSSPEAQLLLLDSAIEAISSKVLVRHTSRLCLSYRLCHFDVSQIFESLEGKRELQLHLFRKSSGESFDTFSDQRLIEKWSKKLLNRSASEKKKGELCQLLSVSPDIPINCRDFQSLCRDFQSLFSQQERLRMLSTRLKYAPCTSSTHSFADERLEKLIVHTSFSFDSFQTTHEVLDACAYMKYIQDPSHTDQVVKAFTHYLFQGSLSPQTICSLLSSLFPSPWLSFTVRVVRTRTLCQFLIPLLKALPSLPLSHVQKMRGCDQLCSSLTHLLIDQKAPYEFIELLCVFLDVFPKLSLPPQKNIEILGLLMKRIKECCILYKTHEFFKTMIDNLPHIFLTFEDCLPCIYQILEPRYIDPRLSEDVKNGRKCEQSNEFCLLIQTLPLLPPPPSQKILETLLACFLTRSEEWTTKLRTPVLHQYIETLPLLHLDSTKSLLEGLIDRVMGEENESDKGKGCASLLSSLPHLRLSPKDEENFFMRIQEILFSLPLSSSSLLGFKRWIQLLPRPSISEDEGRKGLCALLEKMGLCDRDELQIQLLPEILDLSASILTPLYDLIFDKLRRFNYVGKQHECLILLLQTAPSKKNETIEKIFSFFSERVLSFQDEVYQFAPLWFGLMELLCFPFSPNTQREIIYTTVRYLETAQMAEQREKLWPLLLIVFLTLPQTEQLESSILSLVTKEERDYNDLTIKSLSLLFPADQLPIDLQRGEDLLIALKGASLSHLLTTWMNKLLQFWNLSGTSSLDAIQDCCRGYDISMIAEVTLRLFHCLRIQIDQSAFLVSLLSILPQVKIPQDIYKQLFPNFIHAIDQLPSEPQQIKLFQQVLSILPNGHPNLLDFLRKMITKEFRNEQLHVQLLTTLLSALPRFTSLSDRERERLFQDLFSKEMGWTDTRAKKMLIQTWLSLLTPPPFENYTSLFTLLRQLSSLIERWEEREEQSGLAYLFTATISHLPFDQEAKSLLTKNFPHHILRTTNLQPYDVSVQESRGSIHPPITSNKIRRTTIHSPPSQTRLFFSPWRRFCSFLRKILRWIRRIIWNAIHFCFDD